MEWLFMIAFFVSIISNAWTITWIKDFENKVERNNAKITTFVRNTNHCIGLHVNEYKIGYEHGNADGLKDMCKSINDIEVLDN